MREMNTKKDLHLLPDIFDILFSLRDSWQKIAKLQYTSVVS